MKTKQEKNDNARFTSTPDTRRSVFLNLMEIKIQKEEKKQVILYSGINKKTSRRNK